jgi:hypothetical protein
MANELKKAFFLNGGAGRVLCAVPALERRLKTDKDFIIVCDRRDEIFIGTELYDISFHTHHNRLFEDYLIDRQIVELEPYHVNSYYTQKCSLIQAFDILVNGDIDENTNKINIRLSSEEQVFGHTTVAHLKKESGKSKVLVIQPFGSAIKKEGPLYWDESGRSMEYSNLVSIAAKLENDFVLAYMGQVPVENSSELGILSPDKLSIRDWFSIINSADGFLGCDSLGQHAAYAFNKPTVVLTGGTYPINITYPTTKSHNVFDVGEGRRKYSPIRITNSVSADRKNDGIMLIDATKEREIISTVYKITGTKLTKNKNKKKGTTANFPSKDKKCCGSHIHEKTPIDELDDSKIPERLTKEG